MNGAQDPKDDDNSTDDEGELPSFKPRAAGMLWAGATSSRA